MSKTDARLRQDASPALDGIVHFNHAGAGLPSPATLATIKDHLDDELKYGPMEAGARAAGRLSDCRDLAAHLLGCASAEVAFGTGHGQLYGSLVSALRLGPGDRILVSRQEWVGNLIALKRLAQEAGATIEVMPSTPSTSVDVEAVARGLDDRVRLVALTWVGASSPLINPAARLGSALQGSTATYIIDGSQAIGQLPVDVKDIGCDAFVACARKFLRGPRGTALAYVREGLIHRLNPDSVDDWSSPWSDGRVALRDDAGRLEFAEYSIALRLGLGQAIAEAIRNDPDSTAQVLARKSAKLRAALSSLDTVQVHDLGEEKAAFVTFTVAGLDCDDVKRGLARAGINIGRNGAGYTPIDMAERRLPDILRASVHTQTSDEDIDRLCVALQAIAAGRSIPTPSGALP